MKMVIVEDEEIYAGLLRRYLSALVDTLVVCKTWADAGAHFPLSDIAWIDLIVPDADVPTSLIRIGQVRSQNPDIVIFVVSGSADPTVPARALSAGADHFAEKFSVTSQNQIIALMMLALNRAQGRGRDAMRFLDKARQLLNERINPYGNENT